MIYLYISIAIALIIGGLFTWAKIQGARAEKFKAQAQAAQETVKATEAVIVQTNKTADSVVAVKQELIVEQKAEQVKIDAGKRDDFSGDSF